MTPHPLPSLGSRYLRLSEESICLDSASVARLQTSFVERPEKPRPKHPKEIKATAPSKVARYLRNVEAAAARHERAVRDWDAYVNAPIVEALYHVLGEPAPTERLFVQLAGLRGTLYVDVMTGCLFNEGGGCLSSGRVRIYPDSATPRTRKTAAKYVEARKPRYSADDSEA